MDSNSNMYGPIRRGTYSNTPEDNFCIVVLSYYVNFQGLKYLIKKKQFGVNENLSPLEMTVFV